MKVNNKTEVRNNLIKNSKVKEEINQRQISIERLIEKLYLKEKFLSESFDFLSTQHSKINDELSLLNQQEEELNMKISQLSLRNQGITTERVNLRQRGFSDFELNKIFASFNVTECQINVFNDIERISSSLNEYKSKFHLNQEKQSKESELFNKKINELDNETRFIYDDLILKFNSDSILQSEYQKFLKENSKPSLVFNESNELIKDIDLILKQIQSQTQDQTEAASVISVSGNDKTLTDPFNKSNKTNKTNKSVNSEFISKELNFGNLNTPIFKTADKSLSNLRSQSSGRFQNTSISAVSVNYNKSFYLIKNKKLHDQIFNNKVVSLDDLGGAKCCHKLRDNYNYEIKNSEAEKKTRSVSLNTKRRGK